MIAYIPTYEGAIVEPEIMDGLKSNELIDLVSVLYSNEFYPREDNNRYKAIYRNRLEIFKRAIKSGEEFFLMCNATRLAFKIPQIKRMLNFMARNPECGMVGYNKHRAKRDAYHVSVGFTILRTEAIKGLIKDAYDFTRCECEYMCRKIREFGYRVCYVGDLIKDVKRNPVYGG